MDGLPRTERVRLGARRVLSWFQCRLGRHLWARRTNPEVGGARAVYHVCRRCGTEQAAWEFRSYGSRREFHQE
jgi:hypothetical protein